MQGEKTRRAEQSQLRWRRLLAAGDSVNENIEVQITRDEPKPRHRTILPVIEATSSGSVLLVFSLYLSELVQ